MSDVLGVDPTRSGPAFEGPEPTLPEWPNGLPNAFYTLNSHIIEPAFDRTPLCGLMNLPVADYIVWMTITATENCGFNLLGCPDTTFPPDSYVYLHPDPNAHYVAVDKGSVITVTAVFPATSMSHGPAVNILLYCHRLNDPGDEHPIAHARLTAMPFLNTVT